MKPPSPSPSPNESAPAAPRSSFVVRIEIETKILNLTITGALTKLQGLDYRRDMLAAFAQLKHRKPWGVLSDRRLAAVQNQDVAAIMQDVFERASHAGRTHAAVIATNALTQLQMRRLALAANISQKQFSDEASARVWLLEKLG